METGKSLFELTTPKVTYLLSAPTQPLRDDYGNDLTITSITSVFLYPSFRPELSPQ